MSQIVVDVSQGIATITLNRPRSLNALTPDDYNELADSLRAIDARDDVIVTLLRATGKWFCAGTDVKVKMGPAAGEQAGLRQYFLDFVARTSTDCGRALYSHRKILVAALNGPVMGIAAAFLGYFDFIYCMPNAWLSTPFAFLGLNSEGGASVSFVNRMGLAKANEVLLWGKKKDAQELLDCGFVNKIFPSQSTEDFHLTVREHLLAEMEGLQPSALLASKRLLRAGLTDKNDPDLVNLRESYEQAERLASGIPDERFGKIARKEIKHKL